LIGTSGNAGAFTEAIIREMAWHTDRPIIFPLSSPAPLAEATPADLIAWTDGRALIASGGLFTPVTHKGITHVIGQLNNAMLYPGVGLGAVVSRARYISVRMLMAAANALSSLVVLQATIRDHQGHAVPQLKREDFEVFEDGKLQPIRVFRHEDTPLAVGLVIDHSGSMKEKLDEVTAGARAFVRSSNSNDQMFV